MATMEIRPLMARVAAMRPDLHGTHHVPFALFEAIRQIATKTHLMRETVTLTVGAGLDRITIVPSAGRNLLKVWRVEGKLDTDTAWDVLDEVSYRDLESYTKASVPTIKQFPGCWAQYGGTLLFSAPPETQGSVKVQISYVPTYESDTYDLPEIASEAVLCWAEGFLMKIPGPNANLTYGQQRENDYRRSINHLKGLSLFGESGELEMTVLP